MATTTTALKALSTSSQVKSITAALKHLTSLKGVGVATASALLAAVDPSVPFMSDQAIAVALPGDKRYTLDVYLSVVDWTRARAAALSEHGMLRRFEMRACLCT